MTDDASDQKDPTRPAQKRLEDLTPEERKQRADRFTSSNPILIPRDPNDTPEYRSVHLDEYPEWQRDAIERDAKGAIAERRWP